MMDRNPNPQREPRNSRDTRPSRTNQDQRGSRGGNRPAPGQRPSQSDRATPAPASRQAASSVAAVVTKSGVPHGATESGWLPDLVYTGEKFEAGLAFFADTVGRIVRFSREPADLAAARRLEGQVALPGLVNGHSHTFQRV